MSQSPKREPEMDDPEWNKRITTGLRLTHDFALPISQVTQSAWTHWNSLEKWGYVEWDMVAQNRRKDSQFDDIEERDHIDLQSKIIQQDIAKFCDEVGYAQRDVQKAPWCWRKIEHTGGHGGVYVSPEGRSMRRTSANFEYVMNFEDPGTACIFVKDMWSARHKGERLGMDKEDDTLFPKLERWSDIAALHWYHTMGGPENGSKANVTSPRYFVMPNIAHRTTNTRSLIERAYKACGITMEIFFAAPNKVAPWPGIDLVPRDDDSARNEAFLALLGSKHGAGPARMLAQHKAWFGQKKISRIQMWTDEDCAYNLLFEIADV